MAGTRRQYRARDTTSAHQPQRSVSLVGSVVPETAITTTTTTTTTATPKVVEIAESVAKASPRLGNAPQSETPINRSILAFCKTCNSKIGEFYNSWHKVTSSYYSPALLGSYRSLLRSTAQWKEASDKTELAGCIIDLTYCPGCDNCLGFAVVGTPAGRKRFHGREFFKLQRIELRCEISPHKTIVVEPQQDVAPDLVAFEDPASPSSGPNNAARKSMDLDTPLSSSHPLWAQSQTKEPLRHSLQSNDTLPTAATPHPPKDQNAASTATASVTVPLLMSPQPAQPRFESTIGSSIKNAQPLSAANRQDNQYSYPREPREVYFDAIERLQTQTAVNTSALAAQARNHADVAEMMRQMEINLRHEFQSQLRRQEQELLKANDFLTQLHHELQDCHQSIASLAREVNATRNESSRRSSGVMHSGHQDEALELMARRLGEVSHRTTDLETLRDHVAIMSGRIQRLESETATALNPHQRQALPAYQPTRSAPIPHAALPHSHHGPPTQTPARPTSVPQPILHDEKSVLAVSTESAQKQEPVPGQNEWVSANAGVKRVLENGTSSPHNGISPTPRSPKRPRLATGESQDSHTMSQPLPGPSQILLSQAQPVVGSQPRPQSGTPTESQLELPSPQVSISHRTQEGPADHIWRSESQRAAESHSARGRGSRGSRGGRGPGSRGGQVRKSMQTRQHSFGTPEWERDSWEGVPNSQTSPTSFDEHAIHAARGIARRGGGGSGVRGGCSPMERLNEWTPEIGPRGIFHDPPSEAKKTRSKPVRNEEGILVRKDGRPDRRSQSSAANLRKVHARKEGQQREGATGATPTSLQASQSAGPDTPSPILRSHLEQDITNSVRRRHNEILGKIFPDGVDTSRKQHDYAHQVFNEDRDHTAHQRSQSSRAVKNAFRIKKELAGRSEIAETQSPVDSNVDTDDAETSPHGHIQSDAQAIPAESAHKSENKNRHQFQNQATPKHRGKVQVPETQASEGSATLAATSIEAA